MSKRILIEKKLQGRYRNFLEYCTDSKKIFIDELSEIDFIAYRTKYNVSREEIENIKMLVIPEQSELNLFDEKTFEKSERLNEESLKKSAEKMIDIAAKDERQFEVISGRADGKTLKEIGENFYLTRERVRQIEKNAIKDFSQYNGIRLKKFFDSVRELLGGKSFITFEDLKNFIGESLAKILWFLISKIASDKKVFYLDSVTNTIVFTTANSVDYDKLVSNLPEVLHENELQEEIARLVKDKNYSQELLKLKILQTYKRSGKFLYKGHLTLNFKCGYILRERFQNGYKIADETHYNRFVRYLRELFDYKGEMSQRALDAQISVYVGVLCDRGKYIHPDFLHIPQKIILLINDYIQKSERTVLPYKEIFTALKENFVGTQITNQYFLQGVIKYYGTPYNLFRDCLTKDVNVNLAAEFNNFVAKNGEVSTQDIKAEFISFQDYNIGMLLQRCPEIIYIGNGKYLHSTWLKLQENESVEIEEFLKNICANNPVNARYLFNLFWEHFHDFLYRNKIEAGDKLFGILKYMFNEKFIFSHSYISATNTANEKGITNKKALLQHLDGVDEMEIDDILNLCEEQGIRYVSKTILIEDLNPAFIRIDEFHLRRPESIGVTDEIIVEVVENVRLAMERNGGWQSAKTFPDFEWLPRLDISWNSFLLESIVKLSENDFKIFRNPSTAGEFSTAIFVSADFAEDDFNSFCLKVLLEEQEREPFQNSDEILNWLKNHGLANKKLPKFLEGHLRFKANSNPVIE